MTIPIESTTQERLSVLVTTTEDPTAVPPEFSVSTDSDPGSYVAGAWTGAWDPITGEVLAETPLIGAGQPLDLSANGTWRLWTRWTVDIETPVRWAVLQVT